MSILISGIICIEAKDSSLPATLIDISRLKITHVSASSVNGNRPLDDEYYGVLNLFDDGTNIINNINYTSWFSDRQSRHWIKFSFDQPVEVCSVLIETNKEHSPGEFALEFSQILYESKRRLKYFPAMPIKGFITTYELPNSIGDVSEMTIIFPGPDMIEVSEIKVLGKVPVGVDLALRKPLIGLAEASGQSLRATRVRIKNVSPYDYESLVVGKDLFGDLKSGALTEYRIFERAYRYNYVSLVINDQVLKIIPKDYVGETQLGVGYFSYLIGVEDLSRKILSIKAIKDK
jgi:hypothetical protein